MYLSMWSLNLCMHISICIKINVRRDGPHLRYRLLNLLPYHNISYLLAKVQSFTWSENISHGKAHFIKIYKHTEVGFFFVFFCYEKYRAAFFSAHLYSHTNMSQNLSSLIRHQLKCDCVLVSVLFFTHHLVSCEVDVARQN